MKNKSFIKRMNMSIEDLSKYYMNKRKEDLDNGVPLKGLKIRKMIHDLPIILIKGDRKKQNEEVVVINDSRLNKLNVDKIVNGKSDKQAEKDILKAKKKIIRANDKPTIYACTHIGGNDIERCFEAIDEHAYLMLGDPGDTYKNSTGLLLFLNGVVNVELFDKTDRQVAFKRSVEHLNNKGKLLLFPEGTWNLTPNLLVLDLFKGAAKMAKETDAQIIPVAIEQYDNKFLVSIGDAIEPKEYKQGDKELTAEELTSLLRDRMATEKFRIIETQHINRENLTDKEINFAKRRVESFPYPFDSDYFEKTKYIDKDKVKLEEPYGVGKIKKMKK